MCLNFFSLRPQMSWAAGTQCVAKGDHRKSKSGELVYHKGDILTIIDTSMVLRISFIEPVESVLQSDSHKHLRLLCFLLEERTLQGPTQHHRRGRTHYLQQCAGKRSVTSRSQSQPDAVRFIHIVTLVCYFCFG